ncbi:MAG: lipid A biosynthesis lauroyl acyltransferase [Rickettsiaceae bacterium]|nr:lipid A biosynthesis lauroyl acyltransferase [Rickettsiaceae bacterium]
MQKSQNKLYKKIKHIFEYLAFLLFFYGLRLLGLERSASLCSFILRKVGYKLKATKTARKNLQKTFGDNIDIDKTIDGLLDNFGHYIGEFPFINHLSEAQLQQRTEIIGYDKVKYYQENKQPFILCLGHFANWDFLIRNIKKAYPRFVIIYRKANNPYIDAAVLKLRQEENIVLIAKGAGGVKNLIREIRAGSSIAMLVDQKMNDGIEVPFLGRPAMTADAIAKLSLQYNYPIIPCQVIRKKGSNFKIILHDPIEYTKTGNMRDDCYNIMLKINKHIESWVKENPEQWFWFHNRWKN